MDKFKVGDLIILTKEIGIPEYVGHIGIIKEIGGIFNTIDVTMITGGSGVWSFNREDTRCIKHFFRVKNSNE